MTLSRVLPKCADKVGADKIELQDKPMPKKALGAD